MKGAAACPVSVHAKVVYIICHLCAQVTSPQLALLETTMAKMERVDAWILMMGGGNGVDVFTVCTCISSRWHWQMGAALHIAR